MRAEKLAREQRAETAKAEALLRFPDLAAAERRLSLAVLALSKARAMGANAASEEAEFAAASAERDAVCEKNAIDVRGFEPIYACGACGDGGFKADGRICACLGRRVSEAAMEECGLRSPVLPSFSDCDLSLFSGKEREDRKKLFGLTEDFCGNYPDTRVRNFLFTGGPGRGKTFLAGCMADLLTARGYTVIFASATALNRVFLKYISDRTDGREIYLDALTEADFLFIDDLGSEAAIRNVTKENLMGVINERLERGLCTVITTNLAPAEIERHYTEKLFSRLVGGSRTLLVEFSGADLRLQKKTSGRG